MPKRKRKVTCPRCHRSIPEGKLAEHMSQHKGKIPRHLRTRRTTKPKKLKPSAPLRLPTQEELYQQRLLKEGIKSNFSKEQIHSKFVKALKDVKTQYNSLKLEPTNGLEAIEVFIDVQRNLTLRYNPLFINTKTEQIIDALLLHEACHVCTLPDSILRIPDIGRPEDKKLMGEYITNYDEYLAHTKFVQDFKLDKRFEQLKKRQIDLFTNFETIINSMRLMTSNMVQGIQINPDNLTLQLQAIAYDAMFFYVAEDDSFNNWCKKRGLEELHVFINWQFDDFEHIRALGLDHNETRDKVLASYILSLNVNYIMLLVNSKIEFVETAKSIHDQMVQRGRDTDLVELWEKRRLLYEK